MATVIAFIRNSSSNKEKKSNIRFRLTDGRSKQLYYTSELQILPRLWSNETQAIRAKVSFDERERLLFNKRVDKIKSDILDWYSSHPSSDDLTSDDLQSYMLNPDAAQRPQASQGFQALYDQFIFERDCTEDRREQLRVLKGDVSRYELYMTASTGVKYTFDIQAVSPAVLRAFERFLLDEHKIAEIYPEIYEKKRNRKPRGINTVRNRMIYLRSFYLWLRDNDLTKNHPFKTYKIKKAVYGSAIFITVDELHHLANAVLPPRLSVYRDMYVFQSLIGCRVSDLQAFCGRNINDGVLEYIARKTSRSEPVTVRVPMCELAQSIYERYKSDDPNQLIFPYHPSQVYTRNLKKIFELVGLDRWVQKLNPVTRQPEQVRLCDHVGSHVARKTFIGNIFREVRDQGLVSQLTGHKANSEAFLAYVDVDTNMKRDMVSILDKKK